MVNAKVIAAVNPTAISIASVSKWTQKHPSNNPEKKKYYNNVHKWAQ